jgi:hypothetical protein
MRDVVKLKPSFKKALLAGEFLPNKTTKPATHFERLGDRKGGCVEKKTKKKKKRAPKLSWVSL